GRTFDLHGPGWQQEHWCLSLPRGRGLNRNWLPWVAVANVEGILRLEDLGGELAASVLRPAMKRPRAAARSRPAATRPAPARGRS
ncbi:MAG TPA: hypothetical protein VMD59_23580, partial [Acidimicrobiales bacterium]|nr:hypothetical protein [Acidimicrobiales bacterium]